MTGRRALLLTLVLATVDATAARAENDGQLVTAFEQQVSDSRVQLTFVKDLIERSDVSTLERAKQLFNEAETEFLLENYEGAAARLLEAVAVPAYSSEPTYVQGLYYLAESLFKMENYAESKRFYRQAVSHMTPGKDSRYQDCLVRLIRLSEVTGDQQGVDEYYEAAQKAGSIRPEVSYLYAKWTASRPDLKPAQRVSRADADFGLIPPNTTFYGEATYYRAALKVQAGQLDDAIGLFDTVARLPVVKTGPKGQRRLHDLAVLGVARCLAEQGKYTEALAKYHELSSDSEEYVDALFERAEALVRMGNMEEALRTADSLLVLAKDTPVEPDAEILNANLLLKMGSTDHEKYEKASQAFAKVVDTYRPVRDQVNVIVSRPNPVDFFEQLFRREPGTDFTKQLPKVAQGFVDPTTEVRAANAIQRELKTSSDDVKFSDDLAKKLLDILSKGGLDMFPQLREANGRAVQLSNTLVRLESDLIHLQIKLLGDQLPPEVKAQLTAMEAERVRLDAKFQQLPRNQEEYDRRLKGFRDTVGEMERQLFQVQRDIDTERARLNGLKSFYNSQAATNHTDKGLIDEQNKDFAQYDRLLQQLEDVRARRQKQLDEIKLTVVAQANGGKEDEVLREKYHSQLKQMQEILTRVLPTVSAEDLPLLKKLGVARDDIDAQQGELTTLRLKLRDHADEQANRYRQRIVAEQLKLTDYHGNIEGLGPQSGQLIGQIAVDSFKQVAQAFCDIVLKGDVGVVDVAWTRKQEHTDKIGSFGKDRKEAMKRMQDRYKEVLIDVQ